MAAPGALSDSVAAQFIDSAPDGIVAVRGDGTIAYANQRVEELFGWARADLAGQPIEVLIPEASRGAHVAHRQRYEAAPTPRAMGSGLQLLALRRDGTAFPAEISLSPASVGGETLTLAAVRDVSELLQARELTEQARHEMAMLEERERIARDLHDTVIQRIFGVGLQLQAVGSIVDGAASERILSAVDDLDDTIRDLRTAVFRLHSDRASTTGIRERVLRLAEGASRSLGFDPTVRFDGVLDAVVDDPIVTAVSAVVREALANCARHANATSVHIDLCNTANVLHLDIRDNGAGVDTNSDKGGDGIANMCKRAAELGGTAEVATADGGGTLVSWQVPLTRG